jgi:hypothetical protein
MTSNHHPTEPPPAPTESESSMYIEVEMSLIEDLLSTVQKLEHEKRYWRLWALFSDDEEGKSFRK